MKEEPIVFRLRKVLKAYLTTGKHYLLAVSGGADSIALADAAAGLRDSGVWLTVCHVEHGLRGAEALADLQLVEQFCHKRQLELIAVHVDVRGQAALTGQSLEEAARELRYKALREAAVRCGAGIIVTAHHRDDQAETVLLRLLRGSGPEGLAAMRRQQGDILRPLLDFSRTELEAYCVVQELAYCHDSSNDDVYYTRNRIRLELLPELKRKYNPEIGKALVRVAALLQEDEVYLEQQAREAYEACLVQEAVADKHLAFSAAGLAALPAPISKRVLRCAYFALGGRELSYERTEALLQLCMKGVGGKLIQLPGGICAEYSNKKLNFYKK